ncbi:hypothetical protein D9756_004213 [Leucocoprinus leucothites]|uniref:RING-type domain-containing protein n=1 Tax=Leucocoprinus leucothites TaxID=201217 RepID=A0A8H5DAH2_9AGAR|nr:hypothetical protein D9756_004213 [Leucoagaricus leucothites]
MAEEDEFDNLPDPFSAVTEAEWSTLLHAPLPTSASPARSTVSTDYGDDSFMDTSTLAELDRIEASVLQPSGGPGSSSTHGAASISEDRGLSGERNNPAMQSRYFPATRPSVAIEATSRDMASTGIQLADRRPTKRLRSQISTSPLSKGSTGIEEMMAPIFEAYEEELTCPICCDLFVSAHAGNPCGHSYCGDCGWQWMKKSSQHQCPVCRAKLTRNRPLIPNIAMDSLVEKHIEQLSSAGDTGWQPQGYKSEERARRKEKWKASVDARVQVKRTHKADTRPIVVEELSRELVREVFFLPSDDDSSYVEDSADEQGQSETRPRRMRNLRARRR